MISLACDCGNSSARRTIHGKATFVASPSDTKTHAYIVRVFYLRVRISCTERGLPHVETDGKTS